jgi:ketosteroid isomerase-like protein
MTNRQLMQQAFDALARGDAAPFVELLSDDVAWTMTGATAWSGTYRGKEVLMAQLLRPLMSRFADRYTNTARRIICENDVAVVECTGRATMRDGRPYENAYCWVCRLDRGRIVELTEYLDTTVVEAVLGPPAR